MAVARKLYEHNPSFVDVWGGERDDTITERKVKPCTYPKAVSFCPRSIVAWFQTPALTLFKLKNCPLSL